MNLIEYDEGDTVERAVAQNGVELLGSGDDDIGAVQLGRVQLAPAAHLFDRQRQLPCGSKGCEGEGGEVKGLGYRT